MNSQTFNAVARILRTGFHVDSAKISPGAALGDLELDSLATMEFVFAVEDAFAIRIPEAQLEARDARMTLQALCGVIDGLATASHGAAADVA